MLVINNKNLRLVLRILIPVILMPGIVLFSVTSAMKGHYALTATIMALLSLVLFSAGFEKRQQGHRRLILVSLMTALAVVGRFIPLFKPIGAIVILTAIYLGPEAGFLTGALCLFISNLYFGQGPWTPFQMLSMGLVGLFAGFLQAPLKRHRMLLIIYGIFSGILYSFIMDIWTVVWANSSLTAEGYLAALSSAVPFTIAYAFSNVLFLVLLAKPIGEKLDRIKIKYGV